MRRGSAAALALVVGLGLAAVGCGDGGDEGVLTTTLPPTTSSPALSDDYGCGYGFAKGSEDQTLGLRIELSERLWVDQARLPRTTDLGGDTWDATVQRGRNLFANWCSDVIVPPEPVITEQLRVVEGTLTITSGLLRQQPSGPVEAELTGVVAEASDGTRLELGDLTVSNDCWGCFAG